MFKLTHVQQPTKSLLMQECLQALQIVMQSAQAGFVRLPEKQVLWSQCEELAKRWHGKTKHYVVMGTGGSSLGVQVIAEAFGRKNFTFVDNVDPIHFYHQMQGLNFEETGWIITSKSGTTIETLCALEMAQQFFKKKFAHCVVTTEKENNSLSKWAQENSYPQLEIPKDVGGRYSVLSPVGMFPAALMGLNLNQFKLGAESALTNLHLCAELMAQTIMSFERNEWITVFWIYNSRGLYLGRWIQQLWAESLAKKADRTGQAPSRVSTPFVALGTVDQHSVLQQMMEGFKDKFYWFLRFQDLENDSQRLQSAQTDAMKWFEGYSMGSLFKAEALATEKALAEVGRSTLCLQSQSLSEQSLGFFFMTMELVVAGLAEKLNLNAYDQPGVELGKRLARQQLTS